MSTCALGFTLEDQLLTVFHECLLKIASDFILFDIVAYKVLPVRHKLGLFIWVCLHTILKRFNQLKFLVIFHLIFVVYFLFQLWANNYLFTLTFRVLYLIFDPFACLNCPFLCPSHVYKVLFLQIPQAINVLKWWKATPKVYIQGFTISCQRWCEGMVDPIYNVTLKEYTWFQSLPIYWDNLLVNDATDEASLGVDAGQLDVELSEEVLGLLV